MKNQTGLFTFVAHRMLNIDWLKSHFIYMIRWCLCSVRSLHYFLFIHIKLSVVHTHNEFLCTQNEPSEWLKFNSRKLEKRKTRIAKAEQRAQRRVKYSFEEEKKQHCCLRIPIYTHIYTQFGGDNR